MNTLKNIFRNRLLAACLLVCAAMATTGCEELNAVRNLLNLADQAISSPGLLDGLPDAGFDLPDDSDSFDNTFDDSGDFFGDDDFDFDF